MALFKVDTPALNTRYKTCDCIWAGWHWVHKVGKRLCECQSMPASLPRTWSITIPNGQFLVRFKGGNPHLSTTVSVTAYPSTEVLTDLQAGKWSRNIEHNFCNELEILSKDRSSNPSLPYDERRKKWRNKLLHHFFFSTEWFWFAAKLLFLPLAEITAEQVRPSLTTSAMQ